MIHIAIAGQRKALEPHAKALLDVMPQLRLRAGNKRLKQLLNDDVLDHLWAATMMMVVPWWRPQAYYDPLGRTTSALHCTATEDCAAATVRRGNGTPGTLMAMVATWPRWPHNA